MLSGQCFSDLVVNIPQLQKFSQSTPLIQISEDSFLPLPLNFPACEPEVAEALLNVCLFQ